MRRLLLWLLSRNVELLERISRSCNVFHRRSLLLMRVSRGGSLLNYLHLFLPCGSIWIGSDHELVIVLFSGELLALVHVSDRVVLLRLIHPNLLLMSSHVMVAHPVSSRAA